MTAITLSRFATLALVATTIALGGCSTVTVKTTKPDGSVVETTTTRLDPCFGRVATGIAVGGAIGAIAGAGASAVTDKVAIAGGAIGAAGCGSETKAPSAPQARVVGYTMASECRGQLLRDSSGRPTACILPGQSAATSGRTLLAPAQWCYYDTMNSVDPRPLPEAEVKRLPGWRVDRKPCR